MNEASERMPLEETRVLAVHLRLQRFGFAVLKGPQKLLDWGVSLHREGKSDAVATMRKRLAPLLETYGPSALVIRGMSRNEAERYPGLLPLVRAIQTEAHAHAAEVVPVGREEVRKAFGRLGPTAKYDIAARTVTFFPELTWKLPPRRLCWKNEHHNMAIFDAIALGLTYFMSFENVAMLSVSNSPKDLEISA